MSGLDTTASILLGIYLLTIAVKGNSKKLLELAKRDKNFLQWAIAVGVLYYLYKQPKLQGIITLLTAMSVVGFGINAGPNFRQNVENIWQSLQSNEV